MTLLICWVAFPLALLALAIGCGLLVEQATGVRIGGVLLPGVGLAVIVVAAQFATMTDATAELATPLVVALAVAGLALARPWRGRRLDRWALACAAGVYAVFAAPVVASGKATFGGFIKLDDTASWLAITDRAMHHGYSIAGLAPSTYEATLDFYLNSDYPIGGFLPLGVGGQLVGQDIAWLFQPFLALLAAMLALGLYELSRGLIASPRSRALVAFVAAQPAILFGFAQWGGIKELEAAWVLTLLVSMVLLALRRPDPGARDVIPLAVVSAATVGMLSFGAGVWLAPLLVPALVVTVRRYGRRPALREALAFAACTVALAIPSLRGLDFLGAPAASTVTNESRLANLFQPLSDLQVFGIWPVGDFRLVPKELDATHVLIVVVAAAGLAGVVWAWRRRAWAPLLYLLGALVGLGVLVAFASPWVEAKGLAIAAPAVLLMALLGVDWLYGSGRRTEAVVVAAAIAGGVVWSNALAYHDISLAPRDQLAELRLIGERIDGQGPTLMTEYSPYGARYFLRTADPESASEFRRRQVNLRSGGTLDKGESADLDRFQLGAVETYRTLVPRRSPVASRPPGDYRLTYRGRFYEVWQRAGGPTGIVEHLPLGTGFQPGAVPDCTQVLRLADLAGSSGTLAFVRRRPASVVELSRAAHPSSWGSGEGGTLLPTTSGTIAADVRVPGRGRYALWVGGSARGRLEGVVDGRVTGAVRHELNNSGQYMALGQTTLSPGVHRVELRYEIPRLQPGSGGRPEPLGPFVLARETADQPVQHVQPSDARALCGRRLDWVEALRP